MCACGCALERFGQDVSEKLDLYSGSLPGPSPRARQMGVPALREAHSGAGTRAEVIDKGIPTAGLLAHVLVAKYAGHQPLYRPEGIFERAGLALARSTLAQWPRRSARG